MAAGNRAEQILEELNSLARPESLPGMARYGINTTRALGVQIPELRRIARRTGRDHALAVKLWASRVHEARILAGMVEDPATLTGEQMDQWAAAVDSWDLCDQLCANLFEKSPMAWGKAVEWSSAPEEFRKRAAFSLMARLAVSDKGAADGEFEKLLPMIEREAVDERNAVKKALCWALRQIGKRDLALNARAVESAKRLKALDSRSARWTASAALRELEDEAVVGRIMERAARPVKSKRGWKCG